VSAAEAYTSWGDTGPINVGPTLPVLLQLVLFSDDSGHRGVENVDAMMQTRAREGHLYFRPEMVQLTHG
jgi:hypothetical protein